MESSEEGEGGSGGSPPRSGSKVSADATPCFPAFLQRDTDFFLTSCFFHLETALQGYHCQGKISGK